MSAPKTLQITMTQGEDFFYTLNRFVNAQRLTVVAPGGATGHWNAVFGNVTSANIDIAASAATVEAALGAMTSIGGGNVSVISAVTGVWTITWLHALANKAQPLIVTSSVFSPSGNVLVEYVPKDLTDYTAKCTMRDKAGGSITYFEITDVASADGQIIIDEAAGSVQIWVKSDVTATFGTETFPFTKAAQMDLDLIQPDPPGYVEAWITAQVKLQRSVIP